MPQEVKDAPSVVVQSYQFAAANPEVLKKFPCYCGCGKMGHASNYSCYVQEIDPSGKTVYDTHALGCSICVDITQDVIRLLKEKKPISDIQAYIEDACSKYGPSNLISTGAASSPVSDHLSGQGSGQPICSQAPDGGSVCSQNKP